MAPRRGRGAELNALRKKKKDEKAGVKTKPQSSVSQITNRNGGGRTGGITRQQVAKKVQNAPGYTSSGKARKPAVSTSRSTAQPTTANPYATTRNIVNRTNRSTTQNTARRSRINPSSAYRGRAQQLAEQRQKKNPVAATAREMIEQRKQTADEQARTRRSTPATAVEMRMQRTKDFASRKDDKVTETIKTSGEASKKGFLDSVSGHAQTALDALSGLTSDEKRNYTWLRAAELSAGIDNKAETRKAAKGTVKTSKDLDAERRKLNAKQEQRQAEWDKKTKKSSGLQKAIYGAVESGTGMLSDMAVGAATGTGQAGALASMFSRTYGTTRGQAEKEGATEREDRLYAALQGSKEVATELMFPGWGLAKGYAGKTGIKAGERLANALTRNMRGKAADVAYAGLRALGGTAEENAEEIAGWGLDPVVKELAYGKNVRNRAKAQLLSEMPEITSREEAEALNARLNSDSYIDELASEYIANGMSEKKARELATKMRDLYSAYYAGDEEAVDRLGDDVAGELTGAKKISKESFSTSELLETLASTTLLTAATGIPGAITTAQRGADIKNAIGTEGLKALAKQALNSEDEEASERGKVAQAALDAGKDITSTQVFDLEQGLYKQQEKDVKRQNAQLDTAGKQIRENRYVTPFAMDQQGRIVQMEDATVDAYNEAANNAEANIKDIDTKESLTDTDVMYGARAIAGFRTGAFTIDDANAIVADETVKQAFEEQTGIDLSQYEVKNKNGSINIPKTNAAIKDALFAMAADNLVQMAEVETANWMDTARGETVRQVTARMGAKGSVAVQLALDDMDERDANTYRNMAAASDYIYQSALNIGVPWEDAKDAITSQFSTIPESKLQMLYEAGLADREIANDKMLGLQANIGEAMSKNGERAEDPTQGQCLVETAQTPKGSVIRVFSDIADNLGINIHLVDDLPVDKEGTRQANGQYVDGEIYINVNSTFEENLGFIFMHEVTHHLKKYAPEQYKALENLVRDKWFKYNPERMQSEIAKTIKAYEKATKGKQVLTEEEALEEIIADSAHEFLTDKNFAEQVAQEDPSLAKAVLNAIKDLLRRLRQVFSSGDYANTETRMDAIFGQLDILDEAERLWLDAYTEAAKNRAAVGLVEWQDKVFDEANVASQATNVADGNNIMSEEDISSKLMENFDEYKTDKENLKIAAEALSDLQRSSFSITQTGEGGRRSAQVRTIAKGITADLVNEGYVEFRGRKVKGPEDLAKLCQVLRDPRFETFRVVLTKGDKIVAFSSISSRLPGQSYATESHDLQENADIVKDRMQRLGADGYYLIHNHPSGNVTASWPDLITTRNYLATVGQSTFKGHIILDHDKYGLIEDIPQRVNGTVVPTAKELQIAGQQTLDLIHEPEIDHPILGEKISNKDDIAKCGRFVNASDDVSVLLYLTAQLEVRGVQEISNKTLKNNKEIGGFIKNQVVEFGSASAALYTTDIDTYQASKELIKSKHLLDSVIGYGPNNSYTESGRTVTTPDPAIDTMGMTEDEEWRHTKVFESAAGVDSYERFDGGTRFSTSEPIERVKDLIAVHNIWPDDLVRSLDMGGFAMPSIAVIRDNMEHNKYGSISLLFNSDTIDPQLSRDNRVWGGDAYTPVFPTVERKFSEKKGAEIEDHLLKLFGAEDRQDFNNNYKGLYLPSFDQENLSNKLRYGTTPAEAYERELSLRLAFLVENNNAPAVPLMSVNMQNEDEAFWSSLAQKISEKDLDDYLKGPLSVQERMERFEPIVRETIKEAKADSKFYKEHPKLAARFDEELGFADVDRHMHDLRRYYNEGGMPQRVDETKLTDELDARIDEDEYKRWVDNLFEGIVEKEGIWNGKEYITGSGTRRSWDQLHNPVTIQNVVAEMRKGLQAGQGSFNGVVKGAAQKEYKSLDEVRADKGRLQQLDQEEYDKLLNEAEDKINAVLGEINDYNPTNSSYYVRTRFEIGGYVAEILNKTRKKETIQNKLLKDFDIEATDEQMDELMEGIEAIAEIPTGYFEAKPARAIPFSEVKAAIVPKVDSSVSEEIKTRLRENGVPVYEYDSETDGDRQRVVNEAATEQDVRFSITDSEGNALSESQANFFRDSKMVDKEGRLMPMYHGTQNEFTEFDITKAYPGTLGRGFYFSASESHSGVYGKIGKYYLNLVNPLMPDTNEITKDQLRRFVAELAEDEDYGIDNYGYDATVDSVTDSIWGGTDFAMLRDLNLSSVGDFAEALKIFNRVNGTGYDGIITSTETLAFYPQQIKSVDNLNPTLNKDTRYSITDSDGEALSDGQVDYFKNSQARDLEGKLQAVYHTTNNGGFTVFDPSYSDDKRSLFFASNFDVSQTYGRHANRPIEFLSEEEQQLVDELPFVAGEDLTDKHERQRGYYSCYLNLENPLIVDAQGASWNRIPYGSVEENPVRRETLNRMEADAEYIINNVSIEWDDFDDDFKYGDYSGDYRTLRLVINGSRRNDVGGLEPWTESKTFTADEENWAGENGEYTSPNEKLSYDLVRYWEDLGLSMEYYDEIMNTMDSMDGSIDYDAVTHNQEWAPDYITSDGYKMYYPEIFDEVNDELDMDYAPYEGIHAGTYKTRQLAKLAQDSGNDGVIIRNCYDIGALSHLKNGASALSDIYIAFSSNQVKDTRNENPTENPDIRYSITPEDEAKDSIAYEDAVDDSIDAIAKYEMMMDEDRFTENMLSKPMSEEEVSNFYAGLRAWEPRVYNDPVLEEDAVRVAKSKADFYNHLNAKWQDRWTTEGEVLKVSSVRTDIRNLVKGVMNNSDTSAQYKTDIVNKTLIDARIAFQLMKQDRTDVASELLYHSAQRMIEGVEFIQDDMFKQYKDLRDYLRTTRISLGEEYWSDVDYNAFRKRNMGKIKLVKGDTNVDEIYQEMQERWPEWFNEEEDMTPPDMLLQMEHVLESIQPYKEAYSSEAATELCYDIADELYEIISKGDAEVSLADSYKNKFDAKTKAMKLRHEEALRKAREERDKGIKAERAKWKVREEAKKEKSLHRQYFDSIAKSHKTLTDRLRTNTADKHIPEQYKRELAGLLAAFDFQTVRSKEREAKTFHRSQKAIKMSAIRTALRQIEAKSELFHVNDAITDIIDELLGANSAQPKARTIEGKTLDELSAEELKRIDKLLKTLIHEFNTYENVRVNARNVMAEDLSKAQVYSAIEHARKFGEGTDWFGPRGWLDKIINMDEVTPAYMFRMIDPNNEGLGQMWQEIKRSHDKYIRNTDQLTQWMEEIIGEYHSKGKGRNKYGAKQIEEWRSSKYTKTFNLTNGSVTLTPAQMMSLACLANRKQAYQHMIGAGIVVAPVSFQNKLETDLKRKVNASLPVVLTDADIKTITKELTPDQMKVAQKLQQLMATKMADWGNEASMDVIGIKLFEEPDYFPIKSDKAALQRDWTADQFDQAIRNFGFTKAVQPGARNAIMIEDIFEVVSEHCNNMNLYNSYSKTLNDFMKVYNKHTIMEDGSDYSVAQAIGHAYSQKATNFIMEFIKDLNGNVSTGKRTGINAALNESLANAKKASVFANVRVFLQQPTAITRAFAVINPKYLKGVSLGDIAKGMIPTVTTEAMQEMFDHCPIAKWKSWGYYDINMGKTIEDVIMNEGNWIEDLATDAYGKADNITWTAIWQMVKAEMKDTHPDVEIGTDEYWELCNERMSEIVDLTQVVDSPLHRSHAMRSKEFMTKMFTSFMAEPTLTFNMMRDAFIRAKESWVSGDKAKAGKIFGRAVGVYLLQAATVSAAAAIADALRGKNPNGDDDDKDQTFGSLWWINTVGNFKDEMKLWNKVYYVKDLASMFEGWDQRNLALQGWKDLFDGYNQLTKKLYEGSKVPWWKIYSNLFGGFGTLFGIPVKTVMRDGRALFELLGGELPASLVGDNKKSEAVLNKDSVTGKIFAPKDSKSDSASAGTSTIVKASEEDHWYDYESNPLSVKDGSALDNFLNHFGINLTKAEKAAALQKQKDKEFLEKSNEIAESVADKTGEEKEKATWKKVTSYLKEQEGKSVEDLVNAGDYATLNRYRQMYLNAGNSSAYFDELIYDKSKTALKKTIIYDPTDAQIASQENIKAYLTEHGMSDTEMSEIAYKSETKKDLQVALRISDEDAAVESLIPLIRAGLSYEDFMKAYDNRNRVDLKKYKDKGGRYSNKLKSMGTFIWPTDGVVTSHFGYRNSPTAGASSNHPAIDIGAATGTPVVAADGGVVITAGNNGGYGNSVGIKHDNGMVTYYNHLYAWNVKVGDTVSQGQQVGQVGSTGISTGPHLDFKILDKNGKPVDPEKYLN